MRSIVRPFEQEEKLTGEIFAPTSKSYAQRAILTALLCEGDSRLTGIHTWSDDVKHAHQAAIDLGAETKADGSILSIIGSRTPNSTNINAGESGLCSRMLSALLMMYSEKMELSGEGSLLTRPFTPMLDVYRQLGVNAQSQDGLLPIHIQGPIIPNDIIIDGSLSSQFITGLLITLSAIDFDKKISIQNTSSRPYINMTLDLLRDFGVTWDEVEKNVFQKSESSELKATDYPVEADWSGASFLLSAGLIKGDITVKGLNRESSQADRDLMRLLKPWLEISGNDIHCKSTSYSGFEFDANECPDLFPPLVALATYATSPSIIKGVNRLPHKESDRGKVLKEEFAKLGIQIDLNDDIMTVHPGIPTGGIVSSHNDHRIAMALTLAGLRAEDEITIDGAESVAKSYPTFFEDMKSLGAKIS